MLSTKKQLRPYLGPYQGKGRGLVATLVVVAVCASLVTAQTAETVKKQPPRPVVVQKRPPAPQVITVLHRINGLTMIRTLVREGQQVGAFENFEDVIQLKGVHTNIIAGLALDDGETIAAWLPEVEVELERVGPRAPMPSPPADPAPATPPAPPAPRATMATLPPGPDFPDDPFAQPDVTVIERDGKTYRAQYVGLDGITGLSLLKLSEKSLPARPVAPDLPVLIGQRMWLFSPEPVSEGMAATSNAIMVRLGESSGQVVAVTRTRNGEVMRLRIRAARLSSSNIGAVVVNESGETIGIVERINGSEATVISPSAIRAAAKRVLARQTSVPRPWLGVSGEPIAFASIDRLVRKGWDSQRAFSLFQAQRGILLDFISPGSPAELAALKEGDVIVQVNDNEVRNSDDFSMLLAEAAAKPVTFSVVRRNSDDQESVIVSLSQENSFPRPLRRFELNSRLLAGSPLLKKGIETVPLRPLATPLTGTASGLLVISVQPDSPAAKAGLLTGDIIEAVDGQPISAFSFQKLTHPNFTLNVVRKKEKMVLTVVADQN